jgi:hypothetical protein
MSSHPIHTNLARLLFLVSTFLLLTQTLAKTPLVEAPIDNPPSFPLMYHEHSTLNERDEYLGNGDMAATGKCLQCKDKMRGCIGVSLPPQRKGT